LTSAEGLQYKIHVSLPLDYFSENKSYPTLYVFDAEPYLFPVYATAARTNHAFYHSREGGYPDLIVVGIVADLEDSFPSTSRPGVAVRELWKGLRPTRARDYLPTQAESPWAAGREALLPVSGHATTFLHFVGARLVPFVEKQYRTSAGMRALTGKSFSGSAVAHALLDELCGGLFTHYMLCSASLAWDEEAFFRLEEQSWERHPKPRVAKVYAAVGALENAQTGMLMEKLKQVLESRVPSEVVVTTKVFQDEDHSSISYPFAYHSLEWLALNTS